MKRSHSVCAQGGINASVNTKGEGDSPAGPPRRDRLRRRLPRQPAARQGHGRRGAGHRLHARPHGRARSTARPRACSTSAASAARSSTAPRSPARRPASSSSTRSTSRCAATRRSTSRTSTASSIPGEKMVRKFEFWDFLGARPRRRRRRARHRRAGPQVDGRSSRSRGDAVCLATGGCGIIFGRSTNSVINTGTAASAVYQQGACYANGEFIQVHPTAIPGADKLRLISRERARRRRPRLGAEGPKERRARPRRPREGARLLPRATSTRATATSSRATSRAASSSRSASTRGAASTTRRRGKNENEVYLDVTHLPKRRSSAKKLAGILEIYEKFVGEDPYENPMRSSPPSTTRWAASGSTSSATRERLARDGLAAQPGDEHPRASTRSARSTTSTTAPIASARTRCSRASTAGMVAGPAIAALPEEPREERVRPADVALREGREARAARSTRRILADGRATRTRTLLHEELAQTMLRDCTIERAQRDARQGAREDRRARRARRSDVGVTDTSPRVNQGAQFVRHLENMLVLARVIAQGARNRDESRGAHFKPEFPAARRRRTGSARRSRSTSEGGARDGISSCASFDYALAGKPVHVTDAVDMSLVHAARAQIRAGGRGERRGHGQARSRRKRRYATTRPGRRHGQGVRTVNERANATAHRASAPVASRLAPQGPAGAMATRAVKLTATRGRAGDERWEEFEVP